MSNNKIEKSYDISCIRNELYYILEHLSTLNLPFSVEDVLHETINSYVSSRILTIVVVNAINDVSYKIDKDDLIIVYPFNNNDSIGYHYIKITMSKSNKFYLIPFTNIHIEYKLSTHKNINMNVSQIYNYAISFLD